MEKATYKSSGVDLDIYAESMSRLPKLVAKTFSPRVMRLDGGFAGLFRLNGLLKDGGPERKYEDPVLVSCTDGVGTKIKIACQTNRHSTVGIDLVAMSVNDAICCGAEPLFFLDYVATPKDDPDQLEELVSGIAKACEEVGCALIGVCVLAVIGELFVVQDKLIMPIIAVVITVALLLGFLAIGGKKWDEGDNQKPGYKTYRERKAEEEQAKSQDENK